MFLLHIIIYYCTLNPAHIIFSQFLKKIDVGSAIFLVRIIRLKFVEIMNISGSYFFSI